MNTNNQPQRQWYAVYVKSRTEKKVLAELQYKGITAYLPLQKKLRKWSDRKKWVEMPLISGYVFVHINKKEYDAVLRTDHVVCYITFNGKAAPINESDIIAIQRMLQQYDIPVEITREMLSPGQSIEIINGPLCGVRGELTEFRGKNKVCVKLEPIGCTVMVEVPIHFLTMCNESIPA